jgi:hypothetical protein
VKIPCSVHEISLCLLALFGREENVVCQSRPILRIAAATTVRNDSLFPFHNKLLVCCWFMVLPPLFKVLAPNPEHPNEQPVVRSGAP